jgi:hypothetical protein
MKEEKVYKSGNIHSTMKKRVEIALFTLILLTSIISCFYLVSADGAYFPYHGYWISPGQQRAIIFHEANTETLIVTSDFRGNAKDFAWIIPTPTKPEVVKASEKLFTNVQKLARPYYNYGYGFNALAEVAMAKSAVDSGGVVVISQQQVDYYEVTTLVATSSEELVKWFKENNYTYPDEYAYVLKSYIDKGWFFTAIKISSDALGSTEVGQDLKQGHPTPLKLVFLSDKIVFPLKISSVDFEQGFKISTNLRLTQEAISHLTDMGYTDLTDKTTAINTFSKIVSDAVSGIDYNSSSASKYPVVVSYADYIGLSSYCTYGDINSKQNCVRNNLENKFRNYFSLHGIDIGYEYNYNYVPIHLYVISDSKYEADNFNINYGNWVKKSQIEKLGKDEAGNSYIQPKKSKYFLTYLSASLQKSQMDEDLTLSKADDNKKVNAGPETWQLFVYGLLIGLLIFLVWTFSPLGIMFIAGVLILFLTSNRIARIIGWIIESVSLAITVIILLFFLVLVGMSGYIGNYVSVSVLVTGILLILIMVLLMVLESRYKKEDKNVYRQYR